MYLTKTPVQLVRGPGSCCFLLTLINKVALGTLEPYWLDWSWHITSSQQSHFTVSQQGIPIASPRNSLYHPRPPHIIQSSNGFWSSFMFHLVSGEPVDRGRCLYPAPLLFTIHPLPLPLKVSFPSFLVRVYWGLCPGLRSCWPPKHVHGTFTEESVSLFALIRPHIPPAINSGSVALSPLHSGVGD